MRSPRAAGSASTPRLLALAGLAGVMACSSSGSKQSDESDPPAPSPVTAATTDATAASVSLPPAPAVPAAPRGLPPTPSPKHNRTTAAKAALGHLLFHDTRLSADGTTSCARCHVPSRGYGDPNPLSKTAAGQRNLRHAPVLLNVAYQNEYYWDGRVSPLEALIDANWRGQMAADPDAVAKRLNDNPVYAAHFERAFDGGATAERLIEALAAYVRTLRSGDSPWDRYEAGDTTAVTPDAIAGAALFRGRAECGQCHPPPLYTDLRYHNVGVGDPARDRGRAAVTGRDRDLGAFRTPTLRGAAHSAPFFHDGSAADLEAVVDHFAAGYGGRPAITLSPDERRQLLAFVAALTPATAPPPAPRLP